jgi:hypothetical protein
MVKSGCREYRKEAGGEKGWITPIMKCEQGKILINYPGVM